MSFRLRALREASRRCFVLGLAGLENTIHQQETCFPTTVKNEIMETIEHYRLEKRIPGMEVFITYKGKKVFQQGFGTKDRENNVKYHRGTMVNIGTVGACFTAFLYMGVMQHLGKKHLEVNLLDFLHYDHRRVMNLNAYNILTQQHGEVTDYPSTYAAKSFRKGEWSTVKDAERMWSCLNPYRNADYSGNRNPCESADGMATRKLICFQLLAAQIEKLGKGKLEFPQTMGDLIIYLKLSQNVQLHASNRRNKRDSRMYAVDPKKEGNSPLKNKYHEIMEFKNGVCGIKANTTGLTHFAKIFLHCLQKNCHCKREKHFVLCENLENFLHNYGGVVVKKCRNGTYEEKCSLGWRVIKKRIGDERCGYRYNLTYIAEGGTACIYINRRDVSHRGVRDESECFCSTRFAWWGADMSHFPPLGHFDLDPNVRKPGTAIKVTPNNEDDLIIAITSNADADSFQRVCDELNALVRGRIDDCT